MNILAVVYIITIIVMFAINKSNMKYEGFFNTFLNSNFVACIVTFLYYKFFL